MMKTLACAIAIVVLTNIAAMAQAEKSGATVTPPTAKAALADGQGKTIGNVQFQQTAQGVLVRVDLQGAMPGEHALHIHAVGRCDAPSFESAGGHFEPAGRVHGYFSEKGPHAGDLPNVTVPSSGVLTVEHVLSDVTLDAGPRSLLDADGSALVIHARQDDYRSDPAGNAGDRVACGALAR